MEHNDKMKKISVSKMKLASKTASVIGVIVTLVLVLQSLISINSASTAVGIAVSSNFNSIARSNSLEVQAILDTASSAALDLQAYLQSMYGEIRASGLEADDNRKSILYDVCLSETCAEIESYISHTAWSAVGNSDELVGLGVLFESGAFDKSVRDYTLYVNSQDAVSNTVQSYGEYSNYGNEDYYKLAASTKHLVFTDPYFDQGVTMVTAACPIMYEGQVMGVIVSDIDVGKFSKIKTVDPQYKTMFANISSDNETIIYDSRNAENVGTNVVNRLPKEKDRQEVREGFAGGKEFTASLTGADGKQNIRFFYPVKAGDRIWWSQTSLEESDLNKEVNSLTLVMVLVTVAALAVVIAITVVLVRRMINPIQGILAAADSIAKGDLDIKVESRSEDEIGMLAHTFTYMADNLKSIINDIDHMLGEMGAGNFRVVSQAQEKYVGTFEKILYAMQSINRNLSGTLSDINQVSEQVASASDQVSSGAQFLSQGATEQASAVQELFASITEISEKVKQNAAYASEADRLSGDAATDIVESNRHMQVMMDAMNEITNTSNEIGRIIKTIDDIAFQTNILALNAAVEAARAGDAGKGFAVVADEVRNLAGKSAEAAKNTTALIGNALEAIKNGTRVAAETAESLNSVVTKSEGVSDKIREIAVSSEEQSEAVAQVTTGVEQISAVVQTNSATAEESAATSQELSGQAQVLKGLIGKFEIM
jgi:methyl-accepting chemotaxis protein